MSKGLKLPYPPKNIAAEELWGSGVPSEIKMEAIVCDGYFPGLNWQWFRWAYPEIKYETATDMFLWAMHRAIEKKELYVMRPPHAVNPLIGTKLIGNVITGKRESYWIADADEVVRYFRKYWSRTELRDQTLLDHFFANFPHFCFPVTEVSGVSAREVPELDWDDYFLFP